ncbi:hypothetical protein [Streptomyces lydicus]|uniref:hypothetical protein n=1 Tax=Streptomyces lydicus TaxID=47763 RepID=UPI001012E739|nr:hypothetical protein [Streptomyces lydicus]MDC7340947.1 hypothetical protein [Streptomyces lydicus]UEG89367.1 hypothetical protein LJ741_01775 [Streptomyces lydicus]
MAITTVLTPIDFPESIRAPGGVRNLTQRFQLIGVGGCGRAGLLQRDIDDEERGEESEGAQDSAG